MDTPENNGPCLSGVSDDGDGTFLLGWMADHEVVFPEYHFFQMRDGNAVRVGGAAMGGDDSFNPLVSSQPSGFTVRSGSLFLSSLDTWSHDGVLVSRHPLGTDSAGAQDFDPDSVVGIDPSGGTATVTTLTSRGKAFATTYQRFDKNGVAETGRVPLDIGEHRVGGVGVALSGHALILVAVGNSNWQAQWVARDGTAISKPFTLQGSGVPRTQFLMDGSLALGFVKLASDPPSSFAFQIEDGAEVAGPLPAWLSQRSGNVLFAARQGRAYATWGGGGQCGADLEVLAAPSGKSCGCLKVPQLTHSASIGRDGSLIVPGQDQFSCAYDLYPKLLR
ncbi:MAG: hypothetical protein ACJ79G_05470 [Myxococcales bacterium]